MLISSLGAGFHVALIKVIVKVVEKLGVYFGLGLPVVVEVDVGRCFKDVSRVICRVEGGAQKREED